MCKDIDEGVHEFLARRLDHTWFPYLFVDATYLDVRAGHRVVCRALVVATGVSAQGRRKDPGHGPGRRRDHRFLDLLVLRSLRERGLKVPSPHDPEGVVLDYR
ncbi:transposase [Actinomyces sp. oral taxon 414]|uniref:transposase n=1 Tax=Actinomyces sp. oral taxon 414 TaxID=712122 RepID=UPI00209DB28F|nr:transposase [Actinomyces sp. oral taxon 414]